MDAVGRLVEDARSEDNAMRKDSRKLVRAVMNHYERLAASGEEAHAWLRWSDSRVRMSADRANKLLVGLMLDQGQLAERAWDKAEHLVDHYFLEEDNWWESVAGAHPKLVHAVCRYGYGGKSYAENFQANKFPKWLQANAALLVEEFGGDPRQVWRRAPVDEIYGRLKRFAGIGDALAKMGQFMLARRYGVGGGLAQRRRLSIKPDVLVNRVIYRAGLSATRKPAGVARTVASLDLDSPADFDAAVWLVGREHCFETEPDCDSCPLASACAQVGL